MRAVDLIQKKRDGQELSSNEIQWLIEGYVAGAVPDYQMSAFAMAVYFQGMTTREISDLTMNMVKTGQEFDLSAIDGVKVDKHSTGGVGDKVTLILAPLVASFDVPVAKMSGRGLGHTGGTIDKLESIKGFQIERSQDEFIKQVQDIGVSVIGQSDQLVKADKLLYALRDVTATVDTIPLIASSVMSKKIAAGADAILLDVTVGEGAFMKTVDEARQLAQTMVNLGKAVGRKTVAVITDMSQPLGRAIGNRLEILEALEILQGKGRQDISHFICELAQIMLSLANVEKTIEEVRQHLENGKALKKFEEMVLAQGGDLEDLYRPVKVDHVVDIPAQEDGVIVELPAMEFGLFAMRLGAGRAVKTDALDYETGIVFEKKVGESVKKGEIVAKVYANGKISPELVTDFQNYVKIKISDEAIKTREIIEIIS
ncbi:pyrimidine-nucleoside phosphorylase [Streptococcus sp. HMSC061D10]|uniref:pyrimidine-nucleoside phosphorylase n=1 Tax=Streptococcus sp. HMSC061D10 TaxID=1715207 RepID=UPI0008C286E8|nr:pyrimidine-nucleoside phosphorylase [Streptococcus sp. HMSC061D10]OFN79578.1 pyrimidine-nucleoside phosphorylase [Streptococcus sp. HMSC061D10]